MRSSLQNACMSVAPSPNLIFLEWRLSVLIMARLQFTAPASPLPPPLCARTLNAYCDFVECFVKSNVPEQQMLDVLRRNYSYTRQRENESTEPESPNMENDAAEPAWNYTGDSTVPQTQPVRFKQNVLQYRLTSSILYKLSHAIHNNGHCVYQKLTTFTQMCSIIQAGCVNVVLFEIKRLIVVQMKHVCLC